MTPAERLARAITLDDQLRGIQRQLVQLHQAVCGLRAINLDELTAARDEAIKRVDEMPTSVQPEPAGVR